MRPLRILFAIVLLGFSLLFVVNSSVTFTGAFAGVESVSSGFGSVSAIVLALVSGIFFAAGLEKRMISVKNSIHDDKILEEFAKEAEKDKNIKRDLGQLASELRHGHSERAKHIVGTPVYYIGTKNAMLYFRRKGKDCEIIAESSRGKNQMGVVKHIQVEYVDTDYLY